MFERTDSVFNTYSKLIDFTGRCYSVITEALHDIVKITAGPYAMKPKLN